MITAKDARTISEQTSRQNNNLTFDRIEQLIKTTGELGFSRIVLTIIPEWLSALKAYFIDFKISELDYKEPLYPECTVIIISW